MFVSYARKVREVINSYSQALARVFFTANYADFADGHHQSLLIHLNPRPPRRRLPPDRRRVICDPPMLVEFEKQLSATLEEIKSQGLYKTERIITTPQDAHIAVADGKRVLNMCANNYLGLADHPALIAAAKEALDSHGFGMASVRFICGTQDIHKKLEAALTKFLGTEETILYPSCFDANG